MLTLAELKKLATWLGMGTTKHMRKGEPNGQFVAEVWLEWSVCRGSVLYRAAFSTAKAAAQAAEHHRELLLAKLPAFYWAHGVTVGMRDYEYRERFDYELRAAVRAPVGQELTDGVTNVWSPVLPGEEGDQGERRDDHPCLKPPNGVARLSGLKL